MRKGMTIIEISSIKVQRNLQDRKLIIGPFGLELGSGIYEQCSKHPD